MNLLRKIGMICALLMALAPESAYPQSVTCDECRDFDKQRSRTQLDLSRKERQMEKAFKKKEFRQVTDLRSEITELRRKLLQLKSKEQECNVACRPDVVKAANCRKLVREIVELDKDELTTKEDRAKIDEKYNELETCNSELKQLQKIHRK
ncbi:MAG: hypothetical protein V1792_24350 [Pseudomonadota bacterium]